VSYRQARRKQATQTSPPDEASQRALSGLAARQEFDWHGLEARLQAFASKRVMTAVQASSTASERAVIAFRAWDTQDRQRGMFLNSPVRRAAEETQQAAEAADDAVIEAIRSEMQGRGEPLDDWQPTPAPAAPRETGTAGSQS
jgi:hypothetical protein